MNNKLLSMLGLCARAGKAVSGADAVEIALRKKSARLILIDEGASEGTKKAALEKANRADVPVVFIQNQSLGQAIGKPGRMLAAVTDASFADRILTLGQEPG